MQKLTNNKNLPEPIYRALSNEYYSGVGQNYFISVSSLTNSPTKIILSKRHYDEIIEDAYDRLWAVMGSALHYILERGAYLKEEELKKIKLPTNENKTMYDLSIELKNDLSNILSKYCEMNSKIIDLNKYEREITETIDRLMYDYILTITNGQKNIIIEKRFFYKIKDDVVLEKFKQCKNKIKSFNQYDDIILSGQTDVILLNKTENGFNIVLSDYKFTKTYVYTDDEQSTIKKWTKSLNVYKKIIEADESFWEELNIPVEQRKINKLEIILVLKDWNKFEYERTLSSNAYGNTKRYPALEVTSIDIPILSEQEIDDYINKKIYSILTLDELEDNELPLCDIDDLWISTPTYKVYKVGNKISSKNCKTIDEANKFIDEQVTKNPKNKYYILKTPEERKHCDKYCNVNGFCFKNKEYLEQKEKDEYSNATRLIKD